MGNKLLTYGIVLDWLIVAYIQYVVKFIDIMKVLSQNLKWFV